MSERVYLSAADWWRLTEECPKGFAQETVVVPRPKDWVSCIGGIDVYLTREGNSSEDAEALIRGEHERVCGLSVL